MKNIAAIIAILFTSIMSFAQNGPKIEFSAPENTIDYGTISKGNDNGIRVFEFTNTGDAPLIITTVQSTASCTILSKPSNSILPGKSGKIEIKYNMTPGPIRKTISVESNAVNYDQGRVPLKIKGEVTAG
jgi:hypothetical protein